MRVLAVLVLVLGVVSACDDGADDAASGAEDRSFSRCEALAARVDVDLPALPDPDAAPETTLPNGRAPQDVVDLVGQLRVVHGLTALWYVQHHDVLVFLEPSVSPEQMGVVADAAGRLTDDDVTIMSRDDTYAEFLALFADEPEITDSVTPDVLPPSIRFDVAQPVADAGRLETLAGVRRVVVRYARPYPDAIVEAVVTDTSAVERLEHLDDVLAADVDVLLAAARRWVAADDEERTRGGLFDRSERTRLREHAERVATGVQRRCGVNASVMVPGG